VADERKRLVLGLGSKPLRYRYHRVIRGKTRSSLDAKLWNERAGMYLDYDLRADAHVAARAWGGLAPLYCGVSPERAERLLATVREFAVTLDGGWAVPSHGDRYGTVDAIHPSR